MHLVAIILAWIIQMSSDNLIIDFKNPSVVDKIIIVNDGVMGGVSNGRIEFNESKYVRFHGTLSPENNGGFSSFRVKLDRSLPPLNGEIIIRAKGDGKIYKMTLRTDKDFDGVSYQAEFKTEYGLWKEYSLGLSEFKPKLRGQTIEAQPKLLSQNIKQIGLLIADKQFGEFAIELDYIKID